MRHRILLLFSLLSLVVACTPAHTVDQAGLYARKVGVTNQYDVRRWHNRTIQPSSRLLVVVSQATALDARVICNAVEVPFSAAFARVDSLPGVASTALARRQAMKGQYQFLLEVHRFTEEKSLAAGNDNRASQADTAGRRDGADGAAAQMNNPEDISRVTMEIALVDVQSGATVDKFLITANTAIYNVLGTDLKTLLSNPLMRLANDLTGS